MKRPPDDWIKCKTCGHKLMRIVDVGPARIETKCHSCKTINTITLNKKGE